MEEQISVIKRWLDTGSINIFGLPMSGKDTVGQHLADLLGAKLLSSGAIIRQAEQELDKDMTSSGALIPTNQFYDLILPYFSKPELKPYPLVLSSIGRWSGEELPVMQSAEAGGHPIRLCLLLDISEAEAEKRRLNSLELSDRGARADDASAEVFAKRLQEFRSKTLPVLRTYHNLGMLVTVDGIGERKHVFNNVITGICDYISDNE